MNDAENLTLEKLVQTVHRFNALRPQVYYGTTNAIGRGVFCIVYRGQANEFFIFHPDDLPGVQEMYPTVRFIHLRYKGKEGTHVDF